MQFRSYKLARALPKKEKEKEKVKVKVKVTENQSQSTFLFASNLQIVPTFLKLFKKINPKYLLTLLESYFIKY